MAINVSLLFNIVVLGLKLAIAVKSSSLAIIASLVDSVLDVFAKLVLYVAKHKMSKESNKYPIGKEKIEPLTVLSICVLMSASSILIWRESIGNLIEKKSDNEFILWQTILLCVCIVIKFGLWIFCRKYNKLSTMVETLSEDHRNDTLSIIVALICTCLASKVDKLWWIDSAGAIIISLYVSVMWFFLGKIQFKQLVGRRAYTEDEVLINDKAKQCLDKLNKELKTYPVHIRDIISYYSGNNIFVEINIQPNECHSLTTIQKVITELKQAVNNLDFVERVYVNLI